MKLHVVAALLFAALVVADARSLQSTGTWQVVPSPDTGSPHNTLSGVAAVAADDVWAVGSYGNLTTEAWPLIRHWDGEQWTIAQPATRTSPHDLLAVSAASADDVWAVGGGSGGSLVEHWDGTAWSAVSAPSPGTYSRLFGVAAVSRTEAWAVGQTNDGGLAKTLVLRWDGASWKVVPSPSVPGQHNELVAVSAVPGSDELWAVGTAGTTVLVLHWDGAGWKTVAAPSPGFTPHLLGVVASSSGDVWAVGYTGTLQGTSTLTLHWNGSAWSVVPSPSPGPAFNFLRGVGSAGGSLWAAGEYTDAGKATRGLLLRWDGAAWTHVPADDQAPSGVGLSLRAVDGTAAGDVWSVGTSSHALAEHWNGATWTQAVVPNGGVGQNILTGASGSSPTDVWQVGSFTFGNESRTLAHHWDGGAWSLVPSPNSGKRLNELNGVAALSPTEAWAVGSASSGNVPDQTTLVLGWDGERWELVPSPSPGTLGLNVLRAVSAVTPDDVWAVGGTWSGGPLSTLVEHWDGTSWSVVPSPNVPGTNTELYAVTAIAADDVWAAGYSGEFAFTTLAMHWDGRSWSLAPIPDSPQSSNVLRAIDASGPDDVWTVGTALNLFTNVSGTITEAFDGEEWSLSFGVNGFFSALYGVAAVSPQEAWQVGDLGGLALIGHWNGSTWSVFPSPPVTGRLLAATAVSPCDVWAVGQQYVEGLGFLSLSEHFVGDCGGPWTDLGFALAGVAGDPVLTGSGPLTPGSAGALTLSHAAPSAPVALLASPSSTPAAFKGGTLVPLPPALTLLLATSPAGGLGVGFPSWPAGLSGLTLFLQCAIEDHAAVKGVALSNALQAEVP